MRDLNPRKVALYTLSKRAHSAAMRILQCEASRPAGRSLSALETMILHRSSVRRYRAELPQDRKVARVGALWRVRGGSLIKGERCHSLYIESIAPRPLQRSSGKSMSLCRYPTPWDQAISTTHIYLAVRAGAARHQALASWLAP